MAYVPVPKDLKKVKTKIAFNLTKRQLICFSIGGIIGIPFFFLSKPYIGNSVAVIMMILVMMPAFLIGVYEKDGVPAEKMIKNFIKVKYVCPRMRYYKTENIYNIPNDNWEGNYEREGKHIETNKKNKAKGKNKIS